MAPADATSPEPWAAPPPAEPTWAEEAVQEPWAAPAEDAPAPAGELDWLTGPGGVAPDAPPPPPMPADEAGDAQGPGDDDDLEMFRAWLQSLKK